MAKQLLKNQVMSASPNNLIEMRLGAGHQSEIKLAQLAIEKQN